MVDVWSYIVGGALVLRFVSSGADPGDTDVDTEASSGAASDDNGSTGSPVREQQDDALEALCRENAELRRSNPMLSSPNGQSPFGSASTTDRRVDGAGVTKHGGAQSLCIGSVSDGADLSGSSSVGSSPWHPFLGQVRL